MPKEILGVASSVRERVLASAFTYDAVNVGIREFDLAGLAAAAFGGRSYFRLTVHAKEGEPRPLLTQDGPGSRPALIPMHGVAMRYRYDGRYRVRTIFDVEARVYRHRPVLQPRTGRFLFFESAEDENRIERFHEQLRFALDAKRPTVSISRVRVAEVKPSARWLPKVR